MTTKLHTIDAVPAPRLMRTIGATALAPTAAVAELVANSLDARLDGRNLNVQIRIEEDRLEVIDDGKGILLAELREALRLGVDMDTVTSTRSGRMGTYGLGMKTAAASLGDRWGIVTRPSEGAKRTELSATFDLGQWSKRASTAEDWVIQVTESKPDTDGPLGGMAHGTLIWIEELRVKDHMPGAYLKHLGKAFAPFLRAGHSITVGGTAAEVPVPRLVEGSRHEFEIVVDEAKDWKIRGWYGLDTQTHNDTLYGIDLYRLNQLVEPFNKDFFKGHLMTSRVTGEAHLDFVDVNFNKVDFSKGTNAWQFARSAMREVLRPVVEASRVMSRNKHDDSRVTRAIAMLNDALVDRVPEAAATSTIGEEHGDTLTATPVPAAPQRLRASGSTLWTQDATIHIDAQVKELESVITPWDYIFARERGELLVVINSDSRTFKKSKDGGQLACIAVADCISRFLIEREKVDPPKARRVSNEWLHEAVTGESLQIGLLDDEPGAGAAS